MIRGFVMISLGILILVVGVSGVLLSAIYAAASRSKADLLQTTQALYVAEAGLEFATNLIVAGTLSCTSVSGASSVTNTNGGVSALPGVFTVTGTQSALPTTTATLSNALTATATVIPASSLTGYPSSGRLVIDNERVYYWGTSTSTAVCGGTSTSCFSNVVRGIDGTTAATHTSGASLNSVQQCNLSSVGGVPNLTSPVGKRTATRGVLSGSTISEGWAVGNTASSTWYLYHWNKPTAGVWTLTNPGISSPQNLLDVSMASTTEVWAVGNSKVALHYNGTTWTSIGTGLSGNENAIEAVSSTEAWAGSSSGEIYKWSGGSSWAISLSGSQPFNSISVIDSNGNGTADVGAAVGNSANAYAYNGSSWVTYNVGLTGNLNDVSVVTTTEAWIAASSGRIYVSTGGSSWTLSTTITSSPNMQGISMVKSGSTTIGWAVGVNSSTTVNAWYYNGSTWTRTATGIPTSTSLNEVRMVSTTEAYIVTSSGHVYQWNGTTWTNTLTAPVALNSIDTLGKAGTYAAGGIMYSSWQESFQ